MNENDQKMLSRINKYAEEGTCRYQSSKNKNFFSIRKIKASHGRNSQKREHMFLEEILLNIWIWQVNLQPKVKKHFNKIWVPGILKIPE